MASLGSTSDPKELIPGEPESVCGMADTLRTHAATMEDVALAFGAVRTPEWEGFAGLEFWGHFSPEKGQWNLSRDYLTSAAQALDNHASTLGWAQGQAGEAIAKWEEADRITEAALQAHQAQQAKEPAPTAGAAAFTDPAVPLRAEAQEILERAKQQLESAGNTNAGVLDQNAGKNPGAPTWLSGAAQLVALPKSTGGRNFRRNGKDLEGGGTALERARAKAQGGENARYKQFGHDFREEKAKRGKKGVPFNIKLADGSVEASAFKADGEAKGKLGGVVDAQGKGEVKVLSAEAKGSVGLTNEGLKASGTAGAYLVKAKAEGSLKAGPAEVGGSASGYVGAEVNGNLSVGPNGVNAGVDAFAGARVEGEVHGDVGGVGAGVKGEAWAGIGAEADVTAGFNEDGKFKLGGELGAGLGVGGKVGFEITVDPSEVMKTAGDVANAANDAANAINAKDPGALASALNPFD